MISAEESFPRRTNNYLLGQDIIWTQFNEVNFYVEDEFQENFYFEILKKLFSDIKFEKIFPLGGKKQVINAAEQNISNKKKVYIVDLDFDEILSKKKNRKNLFYLKRYSIENYLLEYYAICEVIKEEKPKIKNQQIENKFLFPEFLEEIRDLFKELICSYLVIQEYNLGLKNVDLGEARFCKLSSIPLCLIQSEIDKHYLEIETYLKRVDTKLNLKTQINKYLKLFKKVEDCLVNIPGKYLLNLVKYRIEVLFAIKQMSLESFTYRVARNCVNFDELEFLKNNVTKYLLN